MATFSQWWKKFSVKKEVKQFTWVCGREPVLVDEVARNIKRSLSPDSWDFFPLNAKEDSSESIWSEIYQYPLGVKPRLVVVREAQMLDTGRIVPLLKNRRLSPQNYVVFISSEEKIPREEGKDKKTQRPAYLRAFSGKGDVVECGPFTQATAPYAVAWVMGLKTMRRGVASHLLERANGNLRLTRDLCRKLALFDQEPTLSMVNDLLREYPRDSFSNALLAMDKKTALLALNELAPEEYSGVIGMLDANLELAGLVHDMLVSHRPMTEISRAAGSRRFLVPEILPVARNYDVGRRSAIRQVLSDADEALRRGERTAIMEAVIAFW